LGRTQHGGQIPFQFDLQAAVADAIVVSGFSRTSCGPAAAHDAALQAAFGRRQDDGVD
jgi:hypothetical protein